MTDDRANLEAAQRDLDAKRAKRKAAKDADQAVAATEAKAEIARRLGRIRDAATADPDRNRKIAAADAQARQNATPPVVTDRARASTGRPAAGLEDAMRDALRAPHPADAIARKAFVSKHQAKCWADVVKWWHRDVSQEVTRAGSGGPRRRTR